MNTPKMTCQIANYYKHTRSLSLSALSEAVVVSQCLDSLPAAVISIDSSVGMESVCACLHMCMCVCEHVQYRHVHSCTCSLLCHIRATGHKRWGSCWCSRLRLRWFSGAMRITAVCGMAAHFNACLSGLLHQEPVLACWSLSTNTKYHSKSFSAPVRLMRSAC